MSSLQVIGIILGLGFLLISRIKKKVRSKDVIFEKQISALGSEVRAYISKNTPTTCLKEDGVKFGPDFKTKLSPEIPCNDKCKCKIEPYQLRSRDYFSGKIENKGYQSDIGNLSYNEGRYYKYYLLSKRDDVDDQEKMVYKEMADKIVVSDEFKRQIDEQE